MNLAKAGDTVKSLSTIVAGILAVVSAVAKLPSGSLQLVVVCVGSFAAGAGSAWWLAGHHLKEEILKVDRDAAVKQLVQSLHARWFPDGEKRMNPDYRVSMWVPERDGTQTRCWRCVWRTVSQCKHEWPFTDDQEALHKAGLVVAAAFDGINYSVKGVEEGSRSTDSQDFRRYLRESRQDETENRKRSWKWASLMVRIVRDRTGGVGAVLVIERESGLPIVPAPTYRANPAANDVCDWELQLVADVWTAVREGR